MKSFLYILVALLIVVVLAVAFSFFSDSTAPGGVACTEEAKLCPDGSYVVRVGPTCAFAPCPSEVREGY